MLLSSWETVPKPAAKTLSADERNVLRGRLAALLDENNELLRELACTWSAMLSSVRCMALKVNQKRTWHESGQRNGRVLVRYALSINSRIIGVTP
jgi:hypothetical protein